MLPAFSKCLVLALDRQLPVRFLFFGRRRRGLSPRLALPYVTVAGTRLVVGLVRSVFRSSSFVEVASLVYVTLLLTVEPSSSRALLLGVESLVKIETSRFPSFVVNHQG